jgi:hypothetical protein
MRETMRDYLRRRYRLALVGVVIGALVLIAAPGSMATPVLDIVGATVLGSALLIAVRTRCPKCLKLFDSRAIAALVQFSYAPPKRCPHCGVDLDLPRP